MLVGKSMGACLKNYLQPFVRKTLAKGKSSDGFCLIHRTVDALGFRFWEWERAINLGQCTAYHQLHAWLCRGVCFAFMAQATCPWVIEVSTLGSSKMTVTTSLPRFSWID